MFDQNNQAAEPAKATALIEVIARHKTRANGTAYGVTFTDRRAAKAYSRTLKAAGYDVDKSPTFLTEPTLKAALEQARDFFEDPNL